MGLWRICSKWCFVVACVSWRNCIHIPCFWRALDFRQAKSYDTTKKEIFLWWHSDIGNAFDRIGNGFLQHDDICYAAF